MCPNPFRILSERGSVSRSTPKIFTMLRVTDPRSIKKHFPPRLGVSAVNPK
jgi:hypothetical protein